MATGKRIQTHVVLKCDHGWVDRPDGDQEESGYDEEKQTDRLGEGGDEAHANQWAQESLMEARGSG